MSTIQNKKANFELFLQEKEGVKPPVGFFQHFVSFAEHHYALTQDDVMPRVLEGQKAFITKYQPDFIKIMSDGFFSPPAMMEHEINCVEDLDLIQPAPHDHPWFSKQVEYIRKIREFAGPDQVIFYSVFSPMNFIRLRFAEVEADNNKFPALFMEDPDRMLRAINAITQDVLYLVKVLSEDGSADGFYYSVQSVQHPDADKAWHEKYVKPSDLKVARAMHEANKLIMLHICGWGDFTNPIPWYVDYPCDLVNWATHAEELSLKDGKNLFHKPVIGGFNNDPGTLIYTGNKEELKEEVFRLLDETGMAGVGIGADCTLAESLEPWRISYIQDLVQEYYDKANQE